MFIMYNIKIYDLTPFWQGMKVGFMMTVTVHVILPYYLNAIAVLRTTTV